MSYFIFSNELLYSFEISFWCNENKCLALKRERLLLFFELQAEIELKFLVFSILLLFIVYSSFG